MVDKKATHSNSYDSSEDDFYTEFALLQSDVDRIKTAVDKVLLLLEEIIVAKPTPVTTKKNIARKARVVKNKLKESPAKKSKTKVNSSEEEQNVKKFKLN